MNPKKLAEMIAPYRMTHDQNRNPDVFSPSSYELGIKDFMNLPEVKAMEERYAKLESKFKDCLSMLDKLTEEARSLRDTESIELEILGAAEELVIVLSRSEEEEEAVRKSLADLEGVVK